MDLKAFPHKILKFKLFFSKIKDGINITKEEQFKLVHSSRAGDVIYLGYKLEKTRCYKKTVKEGKVKIEFLIPEDN